VIVGDGHQSVYGFRGSVSAITNIEGQRFPLSQSFRFGPQIAELANAIVAKKKGYKGISKLKGLSSISTPITRIHPSQNHTRIYRTNQDLIFAGNHLKQRNIPIVIYGDMSDLQRRLKAVWDLKKGVKKINHPLISRFKSYNIFSEAAKKMSDPEMLQTVRIIEEQGNKTPDVIKMLEDKSIVNRPKIILVSGHRSKGHEWNDVVIEQDFDRMLDNDMNDESWDEEMNLLYVCVTRAMRCLDIRSEFLSGIHSRL